MAVSHISMEGKITKRGLASGLAKVFDLMGLLCPAILPVKVALQDCWRLNLTWDFELPTDMSKILTAWIMDLHLFGKQLIPRRYVRNDSPQVSTKMHGYCDASVMAYGGIVFIRTMHQDSSVSVTIISAKTRLAPLHSVIIPRLELCGALTLAKLLSSDVKDLQLDITQVYSWTDSSIKRYLLLTGSCRSRSWCLQCHGIM